MDITLDYYPMLGLYLSPDFVYAYDPSSQQLYQQISPGNYQPVQTDPYGGYSGYPPTGGYNPYPDAYSPYPAPSMPQSPVYVNPPRPGITFAPTIIRQSAQPAAQPGQPTSSAPAPTPAATSPRVVVAPAATVTGTTGTYQAPPPPRSGVPAPAPRVGSGGTVKMASEQPDPKKGYWEAFHLMGWWSEFPEQNDFYQASYPVNKVRMTDGAPWPTRAMAIYQGRGSKSGVYIMLYESEENSFPWTKPSDKLKMVQVRPVLPF